MSSHIFLVHFDKYGIVSSFRLKNLHHLSRYTVLTLKVPEIAIERCS